MTMQSWTTTEEDPEIFGHMFALDIAEQVSHKLYSANKNQTWLADQLGVSRQRVSNILSGSTNFNLQTLVNLSFAFGSRPAFHLDRNQCPLCVDGSAYEDSKSTQPSVTWLVAASGSSMATVQGSSNAAE